MRRFSCRDLQGEEYLASPTYRSQIQNKSGPWELRQGLAYLRWDLFTYCPNHFTLDWLVALSPGWERRWQDHSIAYLTNHKQDLKDGRLPYTAHLWRLWRAQVDGELLLIISKGLSLFPEEGIFLWKLTAFPPIRAVEFNADLSPEVVSSPNGLGTCWSFLPTYRDLKGRRQCPGILWPLEFISLPTPLK